MNFRLTLTLVIFLALVTAIYLCIPAKKPDTDTATVSSLFSPKPGEVQSITLVEDGVDRYKFVKQGDQWKMTYPVATTVDNDQLNPIASGLQLMSYRRKFEPEEKGEKSAEGTGTNKPHNIIKFTDTGGHEFTLSLGKRGTDNASVFATTGSSTIYLLDTNPLERLAQRSPDNFRNKTVKRVDELKIRAIDIHTKEGDLKLTKSGDNWLINAPVNARANSAAVTEILAEFRQIQAQSFSKLPKETAGLKPPVATVTVWVEDQPPIAPTTSTTSTSKPAATPITLELGYATDLFERDRSPVNASLADSGEVFTLLRKSFTNLTKGLKELRDPAVTPAPVTGATNITISGEGSSLVLDKKDMNWSLASGSLNVGADAISIGDYLGLLRDLRAINYVDHAGDLKSIGLDPPRLKIDLSLPGQSQREVLLVGTPETGETAEKVTPVMRQGEPTVYLIPSLEAKRLTVSALDFRDRSVDRLTADRIRTITISGPGALDSGKGITLQREGTRWIIKGPEGATPATAPATTPATGPATRLGPPVVDEVKMSMLLADFTPLTANKYLSDKADVSGTPTITVTVSLLEPTIAPTSAPASAPAPLPTSAPSATAASNPATMPAPASRPAIFDTITGAVAGPDPGKIITRTLKIYKVETPASAPASAPAASQPATTTWKAVWDGQNPEWAFEPNSQLIDRLTRETYTVPPPSTQPAIRAGSPLNFGQQ